MFILLIVDLLFYAGEIVQMQCLPLYSLLLALGNPTVDFLSLDIEGAEFQVLKTIPWDKVDIRALSVETQFAGDVLDGSQKDIFELLTSVGFLSLWLTSERRHLCPTDFASSSG